MSRLLITGGSSYLGQHLAPPARDGRQVCYTYFSSGPLALEHDDNLRSRCLDLRDEAAVSQLVREWRPDVIIHTAGSNRSADMEAVIHVAGRQSMSRAEFGLKLLNWWGIAERDTLFVGPSDETWPLDCRLDITLASRLLRTPLLGVDEVLLAS